VSNFNRGQVAPAVQKKAVPDVVEFVRKRLGFEPDERQTEVLRSAAKRGILNCTRQWGKSTIVAAKAVHRAYTQPGSLVLVASPSERQSAEFLRKAAGMVARLKIAPKGDGDNDVSLMLPNGSRIVGLPGRDQTVRGFSAVSLMLIDEAGYVDDAMYKALRPMLAIGQGDLWLMSTPNGRQGFFYATWEHGGERWARFRVPATECARIPKHFLEEERAVMGGRIFRQEYMGEFVDNHLAIFGRDTVEGALDADEKPLKLRPRLGTWGG
jgi:hypothetical protein